MAIACNITVAVVPVAIYSQAVEDPLILYCMFFTSVIIKSISEFFPRLRTSGKVFVFTYFFPPEAFSDLSTIKMENIPKSQRVSFRRAMSHGGFS